MTARRKLSTDTPELGEPEEPFEQPANPGSKLQLLLAEKRTALAVMRTGVCLFTLPLSVVTALIATSRYYSVADNLHFVLPLVGVNVVLLLMAVYLLIRSTLRMVRIDRCIHRLQHGAPRPVDLDYVPYASRLQPRH